MKLFLLLIILLFFLAKLAFSMEITGETDVHYHSYEYACNLANVNARNRFREACGGAGGKYDTKLLRKSTSICNCTRNRAGGYKCKTELSMGCGLPITKSVKMCDGEEKSVLFKFIKSRALRLTSNRKSTTIKLDQKEVLSGNLTAEMIISNSKYVKNIRWLCGRDESQKNQSRVVRSLVGLINQLSKDISELQRLCRFNSKDDSCQTLRTMGLDQSGKTSGSPRG